MPMTVTLTTSGGTTDLTGTVTVTATCSQAAASVKFYVDNVQKGVPDTTVPYSFTWDTTTVTPGAHQLKATVAYSPNMQTSQTLDVTVADQVPPQPPPPPPPSDVPVLIPE